jgi:WD40 repeat protein
VIAGENQFQAFGVCADGNTIAATDGKTLWLLDWPSGSPHGGATVFVANRPPCALRALGSSPDGRWWASAGAKGTVQVHDASTGATSQTLAADLARTNAVSFSPDGQWLASGGLDNDVHVWDARSWQKVATLSSLTHATYGLAWSPDSKLLLAAGVSRSVTAIAAGSWTVARASEPLQFVLTEIAVSPDGRTIAVGGFDPLSEKLPAAVRFLDATTLQQRHSVPTGSAIRGLAFSPDGTSVLGVVDGQKGIAVWPVE